MLAILNIDGTLVDTNHRHAVVWYRALRQPQAGARAVFDSVAELTDGLDDTLLA